MKQPEQKKVLADFKAGKFNTLVATCIAEEGLDIAQVTTCIYGDRGHFIYITWAARHETSFVVLLWPAT